MLGGRHSACPRVPALAHLPSGTGRASRAPHRPRPAPGPTPPLACTAQVRCWTILAGTMAPQAAGVIHTDFERGFIKAEVVAYDDFKRCAAGHAVLLSDGARRLSGRALWCVACGDPLSGAGIGARGPRRPRGAPEPAGGVRPPGHRVALLAMQHRARPCMSPCVSWDATTQLRGPLLLSPLPRQPVDEQGHGGGEGGGQVPPGGQDVCGAGW
jgi:hypothetical protein